jgi:hypothetical protein
MEIIVMNRHLIRTDERNYIVQTVKDGKEPIVLVDDGKPDYTNFGTPVFPSDFASCLKTIKDRELKGNTKDVKTLKQCLAAINEIDHEIKEIGKVFE